MILDTDRMIGILFRSNGGPHRLGNNGTHTMDYCSYRSNTCNLSKIVFLCVGQACIREAWTIGINTLHGHGWQKNNRQSGIINEGGREISLVAVHNHKRQCLKRPILTRKLQDNTRLLAGTISVSQCELHRNGPRWPLCICRHARCFASQPTATCTRRNAFVLKNCQHFPSCDRSNFSKSSNTSVSDSIVSIGQSTSAGLAFESCRSSRGWNQSRSCILQYVLFTKTLLDG